MTHRYFEGVVPSCDVHDPSDEALLETVRRGIEEVGAEIQAVRLKAGLAKAMSLAQATNVYLSEREPWKTAKTDLERTGITLGVALNAIAGIAVALGPYLPFTSPRVFAMLGLDQEQHWHRPVVPAGTTLGPVAPLFVKVDAEMLDAD